MNSTGWRALIPQPIKAPEDAVMLVSALGFCTWGPADTGDLFLYLGCGRAVLASGI